MGAVRRPTRVQRVLARIATEELRHAVDDGQLRLLFQPVHRRGQGAPIGAEALVRWSWSDGTLMSRPTSSGWRRITGSWCRCRPWVLRRDLPVRFRPGHARPDSRDSSLGEPVGPRSSAAGHAAGGRAGPVGSAVAPSRLCLELTETSSWRGDAATLSLLESCAKLGVFIGLDDFGTGYSSLTNLRDFAVSFVKIDSSFTSGIPHDHESTSDRAGHHRSRARPRSHGGGGGRERRGAARGLAQTGCDHLQGFLFSPPVSADAITAWLLRQAAPLAEAGDIA